MEKKKYSIKDLFKIARGEGPSCSCSKTNTKNRKKSMHNYVAHNSSLGR